MNDLEMNATAEGIFKYVMEKTETPRDGIALVGIVLMMIFDNATGTEGMAFATFAKDFHEALTESYTARSAQGPETLQ